MEFCVIAHINRKSISFYYQKRKAKVEKLEYNGKNTHPLYFYVHDDSFSFGDYALDRYHKQDENAYGDYFELIKTDRQYDFFDQKKSVRFLFRQLIEEVINSFLQNEPLYTDDIDNYKADFPLRFVFESDIKENEKKILTKLFFDANYYNVEEILLTEFIKKSLIGKSLSKNDNLLLVESINNDLHLNYLFNNSTKADYTNAAQNLGIDPKISITSKILYTYAITKLRTRLNKEKELQHLSTYAKEFLAQASNMPRGDIELSNGEKIHVRIRKREVEDEINHSGFDVKLFGFIDNFSIRNNIEINDTQLILLGEYINTEFFIETLSNKYQNIISVTPEMWNLAFNDAILEIENNNYQLLRQNPQVDVLKEKANQLLKTIEKEYSRCRTVDELDKSFNENKDVKGLNNIIIKLISIPAKEASNDLRWSLDELYVNRKNTIEEPDSETFKKKANSLLKEIKSIYLECKTLEELEICDKTDNKIKEFNDILSTLTSLDEGKESSSLSGQRSILKTSVKQKIIEALEAEVLSLSKAIKLGYSKCTTKEEVKEYDRTSSEVLRFDHILNTLKSEKTKLNITSLEKQKASLMEKYPKKAIPTKDTYKDVKGKANISSQRIDVSASKSKWDKIIDEEEIKELKNTLLSRCVDDNKIQEYFYNYQNRAIKLGVIDNLKRWIREGIESNRKLPSIHADYDSLLDKGKYSSTDSYIKMYTGHNENGETRFIYLLNKNKIEDSIAKKRFARLHELYEDYFGSKLEIKDFSEGKAFSKPNIEGDSLLVFIEKYKFNKAKASLMGSKKKHFQAKERFYEMFEKTVVEDLSNTIKSTINPKKGHSIIVKLLGENNYTFHFTNFNLDEITNRDTAIKRVNDNLIDIFYELMGDDFMTEMGF